jgi:hypothetical protein
MSGSRRRPGRLGPFVDGYRVRLLELGHAPLSVTRSLAALGHLGRWMDRHDIDVEQLDDDVLKAFLADHVAEYGRLPSAGVMPQLDYLRDEGVTAPAPARQGTPLDRFLDDYRDWLAVERELLPETVRGYTRLAHRFLAERVSVEDELGVERLAGADVIGFLLREAARVRPGSVCCHANQLRQLGRALFCELYAAPARPVNTARFLFLDPRAETTFGDWDRVAGESVAILRSAAGRDPHNRELSDLVGELATQSDAFRTRWAAHNVRFHNTGIKHFHHPVVGDLELTYNRLDLAADPGLTLFTYTAEPGSRSEDALKLLGSWAATADAESETATDLS